VRSCFGNVTPQLPRSRPPVKQEKPKAYRSPLWRHLDEIQKWRLAQETWEAIANKLSDQYRIKVSLQGVQVFFKRATLRDGRRPLGFGPDPSTSIEIQTGASAPEHFDSIYEEARKQFLQKV
jgi:hypothetical protein